MRRLNRVLIVGIAAAGLMTLERERAKGVARRPRMFTRSHDANEDERRRQPRITRITPNDARAAKTTEEAAATRSVAVAPASGLMSGHRHQCPAAWRRVRVAALRAARGRPNGRPHEHAERARSPTSRCDHSSGLRPVAATDRSQPSTSVISGPPRQETPPCESSSPRRGPPLNPWNRIQFLWSHFFSTLLEHFSERCSFRLQAERPTAPIPPKGGSYRPVRML